MSKKKHDKKKKNNQTLITNSKTHKFESKSGRSQEKQMDLAYELHQAGKTDQQIADSLEVSLSTARQYIRKKRKTAIDAAERFVVYTNMSNPNMQQEPLTIRINTDILDRLKRLEKEHTQYTQTAIENAVIDEGLKRYGY